VDLDAIKAVVDQYVGHGWRLRKATLSRASLADVRDAIASLDSAVVLIEGPNEALWFSRRSLPDREAWELRRIAGSPFALVAILEDSLADDEREAILFDTERRMFDGSHPEPTSH
jgi:hypothetical protein